MSENFRLEDVVENGWLEVEFEKFNSLFEFASYYGRPVGSRLSSVAGDILRPMSQSDTKKYSMSRKYGLGVFPYHTDCAYYTRPPRFIFFRATNTDTSCATMLLRLSDLNLSIKELKCLQSGLCIVKGYMKSFYSSYLENGIFRWDIDCIEPLDKEACIAGELVGNRISVFKPYKYYWGDKNKVLIVDNWQVIHAREQCGNNNRALERILVEVNNVDI